MKLKVIISRRFPLKGFKALTAWPFVFVRKDMKDSFGESDMRHETTHAIQQAELFLLPFFILYALEWLLKLLFCKFNGKRAYMSISFEQEAYEHQSEVYYNEVRRHYAWFRHVFTLTPYKK